MEDCVLNKVWTFWIQGHAFWIDKCTSYFSASYKWCISRIVEQICHVLLGWHFDLFKELSRIWRACEVGITKTLRNWIICKVRKVRIPSTKGRIPLVYYIERRPIDGSEESPCSNKLDNSKDSAGCAMFSRIC